MIGCLIAARVAEEYGVDRTQVYRVEADREQGQSDETKRVTLTVVNAQRQALLDARDEGNFSADSLSAALAVLDADQIGLELKGAPTDYTP
ncbi:MAG: hypothetical protein H0V83_05535 [Rubrobacter sp.]|nr:hypothetical protein [Rubrobacter sp.]